MPELLVELLSEDIPARMQARAAEDLKRLITDRLEKDGLKFESLQTFVTPRRLTLVVDGLPVKTEAVEEDRRGPPKAAPEKAVAGFAKSNGVSVHQLEIRDTGKGEYYFAVVKEDTRQTIDYMPLIVSEAVFNMGWPKSMRWHSTATTWVRPIQRILAIFDGKPIDDVLQLGLEDKIPGLKFAMNGGLDAAPGELEIPISNRTQGHPFLAPKPFKVKNFADYKAKLKKAHVILDPAERRKAIWKEAQKLAKAEGLTVKEDEALLADVAGMVEWPKVLIGGIDEAFMDLWSDVLVTVMRQNQKYFSLLKPDGSLAPRFIVVADTEPDDGGEAIVTGNERVLRARLADAKFFRDQDLSQSLESYVPRLNNLVFHARLGSMGDKVRRLETLADLVGAYLPGSNPKLVRRAAHLCKADLVTQMVGEFPELQGIMGGRYAYYGPSHENQAVAMAIREHHSPLGPNDACPAEPVSVAVALADKIDTLVGFFGINEKPTGSKDPFALRRAALGVIRLVLENNLSLPLSDVIRECYALNDNLSQPSDLAGNPDTPKVRELLAGIRKHIDDVVSNLVDFFADRLKVHLREKGVRHDLIDAVFTLDGEDDLVRLMARVESLQAFLDTEDGEHLLTAYKRAANIVRIEEKKDGVSYDGAADTKRFKQPEERDLHDWLGRVKAESDEVLKEERFDDAMKILAGLRKPVDVFFDEVTVNCDEAELRENRLKLLSEIRTTMNTVADFSKIEG